MANQIDSILKKYVDTMVYFGNKIEEKHNSIATHSSMRSTEYESLLQNFDRILGGYDKHVVAPIADLYMCCKNPDFKMKHEKELGRIAAELNKHHAELDKATKGVLNASVPDKLNDAGQALAGVILNLEGTINNIKKLLAK
ncbi:MAG: hypothetical protein ABIG20_02040 [archaeon]